jgi:hypothetical protein
MVQDDDEIKRWNLLLGVACSLETFSLQENRNNLFSKNSNPLIMMDDDIIMMVDAL